MSSMSLPFKSLFIDFPSLHCIFLMPGGRGVGEVQAGVGGDEQQPGGPVQGGVEDGRQGWKVAD